MSETERNDDPRVYWDQEAGPSWVQCQPMLDRILEPAAGSILEAARLDPGESVLDVGCGSATLSLQAAERVGADGSVVGVDVSTPLVEHARSRTAHRRTVEIRRADAEEADLPNVDAIVSRFGVMFFRDTTRAFRNLHASLRPGGRLVFACWAEPKANPWLTWPMGAIRDLLPEDLPLGPPADADVPGPFRFANQDRVKNALAEAGFSDVSAQAHDQELETRGTHDEILGLIHRIGPLSRLLPALDEPTAALARRRVAERVEELHDGEAIRLGAFWWVIQATRADD